jgi:hypothetical protein
MMFVRTVILLAAAQIAAPFLLAQPKPALQKDEVSLHEGKKVKGGFEPSSTKEANNNRIRMQCGTTKTYGMEITASKADTGHFELSNVGTCDIVATVETLHIEDDSGTTTKDEHSIEIPRGAHRSFAFPVLSKDADKKKFVVITIKCKANQNAKDSACLFIQNLTVGQKIATEAPAADGGIKAIDPQTAAPPGTTVGGSPGSKCSTPADGFLEVYTFYNILGGDVQMKFTVVNGCLCEQFIAQVSGANVTNHSGQPLGKTGEKGPQSISVPAKNDTTHESGARTRDVTVKKNQAITIKVGCSGSNNNTSCQGRIKDIQISLK